MKHLRDPLHVTPVMNALKYVLLCAALLPLSLSPRALAGGGSLCCPADVDHDTVVGAADLGIVLGAWGPAAASDPADIDGSGEVDGIDLGLVLGGWGTCPAPCLKTLLVGSVALADGTPVPQAVVVTQLGGQGVSGADGAFGFEVEVGRQTTSLNVTAVASIRGVTYTGTKLVSPVALDGVTDAGEISVTANAPRDPTWLPTFGGAPGMNGSVNALTTFDDGSGDGPALYAGGTFTAAGGTAAHAVAKWDGSSWSPLGSGLSGSDFFLPAVNALTTFDDGSGGGPALCAGGEFTTAGGTAANSVAKWDGSSWSPLGSGMVDWIWALTTFDDGSGGGPALYAGGKFAASPAVDSYLAKWGCDPNVDDAPGRP
ncbi:MAG: hypothetical protein KDA22_11930 [Phycisphaerales bacterium]|nr:hypothetical protein [Phycisphaerales bacterium]